MPQLLIFLFITLHNNIANALSRCDTYIKQQERFFNIPSQLLDAISLVESGRTLKSGKRIAWPWTINVNGRGYIYESKQEAIQAVKDFQKKGETSIDIGCLQINLKHHPKAFRHLEDAFDPQLNVAYAAQFLYSLKQNLGSWRSAVAHYHSATPQYHIPYRNKIDQQWGKLRQKNGNTIPVLSDINYIKHHTPHQPFTHTQKMVSSSPHLNQITSTAESSPPAPPGKFFSVTTPQKKSVEPYARVKKRVFYHVLPQQKSQFFPMR